MKRLFRIALLVVILFVTGCAQANIPTVDNDPTDYTDFSTTELTSTPAPSNDEAYTDPSLVMSDFEWYVEESIHLPYEEYFSSARELYSHDDDDKNEWNVVKNEIVRTYALLQHDDGLYVSYVWGYNRSEPLYHIPGSENLGRCDRIVCDGTYGYFVHNENEILRIELVSGETSVLFSGGEFLYRIYLRNSSILYFCADNGESICFYRLYLPTMTLDVLYDQIPVDTPKEWFIWWPPESSLGAVGWWMMNPDFYPLLQDALADPNYPEHHPDYKGILEFWENRDDKEEIHQTNWLDLIEYIEKQYNYEIPYRVRCYYDYVNDNLSEEYFTLENRSY